ncbi:cyclic-phosphate processing receiver domain-containing protein [Peribacillus sp. SCS-155]|uniref:cyclic-phosphate processing receiver domain-containing protein n=1 Tax=Peribacillus sedimenti TaxID=3115297 RepID=UPI003906192F
MEKISVFLDDYRQPPDGYVLAETIDACLELLQNFNIEHLSLDHDLFDKTRNGYLLVQIMVKDKLFANRITIHSANSVGGKAMYNFLKQAQNDSIIPKATIVTLRPLPLHYFPSKDLKRYQDVK